MKRNAKKILLLNPPGDQIFIRDYYCSKVSKAHYLYHPVDLLMMSGRLAEFHEIRVIDGMVEGWTVDSVAEAVRSYGPDVVVFLTGVVSFEQDFEYIRRLKTLVPFCAVASGELFLDKPTERLTQFPILDAAVLDFTDPGILTLIDRAEPEGFASGEPIKNIVYRSKQKIISGEAVRGHGEEFELPVPKHDVFPNHKYRYPFVRRFPFATVLTDFGCPYHCRFCTIGQLGHKIRTVESVLAELDFIKSLGFRDLYIDDQTFGANRSRTEKLLTEMIRRKYRLGFICFSRADVVDPDLLKLMKKAGCHTVVFGVESKSDAALTSIGKGMTCSRIRQAIEWCKNLHLRTVGTFIVGLPGMTKNEAEEIGDFAIELGLDFASFNVPVPRPGTDLRALAVEKNWISSDLAPMDQSGSYTVMGNEHMTAKEVQEYRDLASRRFYLRFGYLLKRLMGIRTLYELKSHMREMINLMPFGRFSKRH